MIYLQTSICIRLAISAPDEGMQVHLLGSPSESCDFGGVMGMVCHCVVYGHTYILMLTVSRLMRRTASRNVS
jgi:hypothetical protein